MDEGKVMDLYSLFSMQLIEANFINEMERGIENKTNMFHIFLVTIILHNCIFPQYL